MAFVVAYLIRVQFENELSVSKRVAHGQHFAGGVADPEERGVRRRADDGDAVVRRVEGQEGLGRAGA